MPKFSTNTNSPYAEAPVEDEEEVDTDSTTRVRFSVDTTSSGYETYRIDVPSYLLEDETALRRWIRDNSENADIVDSETTDTNTDWSSVGDIRY